jgi:aldehyde dehydrogenase (NAD+)
MSTLRSYGLHIAGAAVPAESGATYQTLNPYTGQPWAEVADGSPSDVDEAVRAARSALHGRWGR